MLWRNAGRRACHSVPWPPTDRATEPVSHRKRTHQSTTNMIDSEQKHRKINETDLYPAAHNGLVAGSNPAGLARAIGSARIGNYGTLIRAGLTAPSCSLPESP